MGFHERNLLMKTSLSGQPCEELNRDHGSIDAADLRLPPEVESPPVLLEIELYCQLHLPGTVGCIERLSEAAVVQLGVGGAEHWMIERILGLQADLKVHCLSHRKLLRDRQVCTERCGSAHASNRPRSVA